MRVIVGVRGSSAYCGGRQQVCRLRATDGQVLVCNDILGLDLSFKPKFVKRYAELQNTMIAAFEQYAAEVRSGTFPDPEHSFGARKGPKKTVAGKKQPGKK